MRRLPCAVSAVLRHGACLFHSRRGGLCCGLRARQHGLSAAVAPAPRRRCDRRTTALPPCALRAARRPCIRRAMPTQRTISTLCSPFAPSLPACAAAVSACTVRLPGSPRRTTPFPSCSAAFCRKIPGLDESPKMWDNNKTTMIRLSDVRFPVPSCGRRSYL